METIPKSLPKLRGKDCYSHEKKRSFVACIEYSVQIWDRYIFQTGI